MALKFRFNNKTYTLPVVPKTADTTQLASNGSLVIKTETDTVHAFLVPYKESEDTISIGNIHYYYSSNSPSIHCRKNNTNYSCCNNYQEYYFSTWTFYSLYGKKTTKKVGYILNSFLGSDYNQYPYKTSLAPVDVLLPKRHGYIFKAWCTTADGSGDQYDEISGRVRSTASDAYFYALWAKIDAGYYISDDFWNQLVSWFEYTPKDYTYSLAKVTDYIASLVIGSTSVPVPRGSIIRLYFEPLFGYLEVNGTLYNIKSPEPKTINVMTGGWLVDKYFEIDTFWSHAYSYSNTWQTTQSGYTIYYWAQHYYTVSITIIAAPTDEFDFVIMDNSGVWIGDLTSNPVYAMNGIMRKTMSAQVSFRAQSFGGDSNTYCRIGLRDRTNNVNAIVTSYLIKVNLSFGTTESEE